MTVWNFHSDSTVVWRVQMFPLLTRCFQTSGLWEASRFEKSSFSPLTCQKWKIAFVMDALLFPLPPLNRRSSRLRRRWCETHNALNIPVCQPEQCGERKQPLKCAGDAAGINFHLRQFILERATWIPSKKTNRGLLSSQCSPTNAPAGTALHFKERWEHTKGERNIFGANQ